MKNHFKRAGVIILSLCLFVGLFACSRSNSMELTPEAKSIVSTKKIGYTDADGKATFRIVRPDAQNETVGPVAIDIFKQYKETYNAAPKQLTDIEDGTSVREIIVGDCDREATQRAKELLKKEGTGRDSDFLICSIGDDIVIYGGCAESVTAAGKYFVENFLNEAQDNGIYYLFKGEEAGMTVCSISDISRFTVVRPIYNVSYITQLETERLVELLYEKTGYAVPIVHDNVSLESPKTDIHSGGILQKTEAAEYEIIIGNCDREGVNKNINISYNYEIRIEGNKIYLNGGSPYATAMAVSEFIKIVESNDTIDSTHSVENGNYNAAVKGYDTKTYYRPVWWDEFNGTEINENNWYIAWGAKGSTSYEGKPCYRGNYELKNNYVEDGKLVIEAVKTEDAYYGGMLKTDRTMEFLYGFLEISDIHPKGNGFWTALWTVSKSNKYNKDMWYSETDIDESFGEGTMIKGNLWAWPTSYGRNQLSLNNGRSDAVRDHGEYNTADPRGLWMDFHTYGFQWVDCKTVRFTVDGYVWRETVMEEKELQTAYSQYMYLQVSMATAFASRGMVTQDEWEWENTNRFIVDWVYLYQLEGNGILRY